MQKMKATLILENGMTFAGRSIGSGEERICEMVFNTSMTGYQEILTDPSYAGQGVVMSYPSLAITASTTRTTSPAALGWRPLLSAICLPRGVISAVRTHWTAI